MQHLKGKIDHNGVLHMEVRGEMIVKHCQYDERRDCKDSCVCFGFPHTTGEGVYKRTSITICNNHKYFFSDFEVYGVKLVSRDREALSVLVMEWANKCREQFPDLDYDKLYEICCK